MKRYPDDDKRAEIAEDIDRYKHLEGNTAMSGLVRAIEESQSEDLNRFDVGYFRGQFDTIRTWLRPDALHEKEAAAAVDAFSAQVNEAESNRMKK